jgi:uncharacterized protein YbbC (DUF1343 family)
MSPLAALALSAAVQVGLERAEVGAALRGRRVGLLANAASVTLDGRQALVVLRAQGVQVARLFAPEHGWDAAAAAGARVADSTDASSGLPVVSIYGAGQRPTESDLAGLDALVFDLQDAGVRFYTYNGLLLSSLDAAAQADVELVVLDRPNPLGGERVEGPTADPDMRSSLVSRTPGPLIHGLTSGELARLANARRSKPARLRVVPMAGWRREMTWADTERPWVPPSPNLRSAEAALAYPGVCLLEATNVSEGRGTEAPFLLLGAPWMRPERLVPALSVPGFSLEPARFTPVASPAAPDPKHAGEPCAGLRVRVTDARAARPYALGLALLSTLRSREPEFRWLRGGAGLDALLGTRTVRERLERGEPPEVIQDADRDAILAFRRERRDALLY